MTRPLILLFLLLVATLHSTAQIRLPGYRQADVDHRLYARWKARWISLKGEPGNVYGVYHFRKTFTLESKPRRFIVHVSADNRYKLYCNGRRVSLGPARCDTYNWNFETVDLAPYLSAGRNVLAAEVWNFADLRPAAQMTLGQTGFLLQGNTENEDLVNTDTS